MEDALSEPSSDWSSAQSEPLRCPVVTAAQMREVDRLMIDDIANRACVALAVARQATMVSPGCAYSSSLVRPDRSTVVSDREGVGVLAGLDEMDHECWVH